MIKPIVIKVTDKVPELVSGPEYVVCDNSDYTVAWQLDEEWAQLEHRTMQVNYKDGTYERVLFTGSSCTLPAIPVSGPVHVGLFAGDIHTTRPARLLAVRSATTDGGEERDPMPNGYAQAIKTLDAKLDKNQGADNAGKALVVGDDGNVVPGEAQGGSSLPVASPTQLGGVKPVAKTDDMTKNVGVDGDGGLWTEPTVGDNTLGITGARVGQIAKITAVDASGVPTAWSPVDMAGGDKWEKLIDTSLAESVESVTYTFDDCKRIKALIAPVIASDEPVFGWKRFTINNVSYPSLNNTMRSYEGICLRIDSEYPPYVQANANTNTKLSVNGLVGGAYTAALENIAPNGITEFGCQTAEILKAGTKIEIWGVKS